MGTIFEDVFLGTTEKYNQKLEMLVKMAQPEKWTYRKIRDKDPYRILRNYIQFTVKMNLFKVLLTRMFEYDIVA